MFMKMTGKTLINPKYKLSKMMKCEQKEKDKFQTMDQDKHQQAEKSGDSINLNK